jgi:hypothetical protein
LRIVQAESLVDGDVRDWAPGGIPIPGANGAAGGYEDPTAIPGQGLLVSSLVLEDASGYLRTESIQATADAATRRYNITLQNALQNGGQHVHVAVVDEAGWTYSLVGETMRVLDANQTMTFALVTEANGTGPLRLDVLTDVGGRLGIYVEPDGRMWTADGISAAPGEPGKTTGAPAPGVLLLVVALAAVAALRRR